MTAARSRRIGLLGGAFDPVHVGHLALAEAARRAGLEEVRFVVAGVSPFKPAGAVAPAEARLAMARAAVAGRPGLIVDDSEIRRGGVSYTIETLRTLADDGVEVHLVLGADAAATLPQWREAAEIARRARILVLARRGAPRPDLPPPFDVRWADGEGPDVSSSAIRARVRAGLPVDGLTPSAVAEIIRREGLYR